MIYILIALAVLSLSGIVGIFAKYATADMPDGSTGPIILGELVHPKIKEAMLPHVEKAKTMARVGKLAAQKHFYSYILTAARKVMPFVEKISHKVEDRLTRVRNAIRGRGDIPTNRGSASLFLQHISSTPAPKTKSKKTFTS